MNKYNQHKRIWDYLTVHPEGLTTLEATYKLRITKLSTRISEMIPLGYKISKTPETNINEYGERSRYIRYRRAA